MLEGAVKNGRPFSRSGDGRRFLRAAAHFDDGLELLNLLTAPQWYGSKQLRLALCSESAIEFLERSVLPFLAFLGSDEMNMGMCRGATSEVVDVVYTSPGLMGALRDALAGGFIAATSMQTMAWLALHLATRLPEARADAVVRAIADELSRRDVAGSRRLQVVLRSGSGATSEGRDLASMSLDAMRDVPGGRHPNDFADFRDIKLLPIADEVTCERDAYLPPRWEEQSAAHAAMPSPVASSSAPSGGTTNDDDGSGGDELARVEREAAMLDRQFRLLREDMVATMRVEWRLLNQSPPHRQAAFGPARNRNAVRLAHKKTFGGIALFSIELSPRPCVRVRFKLSSGHAARRLSSKKERLHFWSGGSDKHTLPMDSLVALVRPHLPPIFAQVVCRDESWLADETTGPSVGLSFQCDKEQLGQLLADVGKGLLPDAALVQAGAPVFQYVPVLRALQRMDNIQLGEELVFGEPSAPAAYLRDAVDVERELHLLGSINQSQRAAIKLALSKRVALIQGPPGTGKTFLGVRIAEIIHRNTPERILCVCFTNHALDSFLLDLHAAGIDKIARIGGRCTSEQLDQFSIHRLVQAHQGERTRAARRRHGQLKGRMEELTEQAKALSSQLNKSTIGPKWWRTINTFLGDNYPHLCEQLTVRGETDADGFRLVGPDGAAVEADFLWRRWLAGADPGPLADHVRSIVSAQRAARAAQQEEAQRERERELDDGGGASHEAMRSADIGDMDLGRIDDLFALRRAERNRARAAMQYELFQAEREELSKLLERYEACRSELMTVRQASWAEVLRGVRVIGCTTTGAAKFKDVLADVTIGVLLVEEAAEILEAHVLTSLQPNTKHLIMIGDHKQLRPKLESFALTVAGRGGHDFNRSLFERLVVAGSTHVTLNVQHRMRPSISRLIRPTYPELADHESVHSHPPMRGMRTSVVFVDHDQPEGTRAVRGSGGDAETEDAMSKTNQHEAQLVSAIVVYLLRQGYAPEQLVVLTPYLGQLALLRRTLARDLTVLVDERDEDELVAQAGGEADGAANAPAAAPSAGHTRSAAPQPSVRVATVDNYQGEEADVVIHSLVRCNEKGTIGFLREPERVNVLLSRARHGQILVGSASTLRAASVRDGTGLWKRILDDLEQHGELFDGVPIACAKHARSPACMPKTGLELSTCAPCGGCTEPCDVLLPCGHECPLSCHAYDEAHASVACSAQVDARCLAGHLFTHACSEPSAECPTCSTLRAMERAAREREAAQRALETQTLANLAIERKQAELALDAIRSERENEARLAEAALAARAAELEAERAQLQRELDAERAPTEQRLALAEAMRRKAADFERMTIEARARHQDLEAAASEAEAAVEAINTQQEQQELQVSASVLLATRGHPPLVDSIRGALGHAVFNGTGVGGASDLGAAVRGVLQSHTGAGRNGDELKAALTVLVRSAELAQHIISSVLAPNPAEHCSSSSLPPVITRAMALIKRDEHMRAIAALGAGADPDPACAMLEAVCKLHIGETASVSVPSEPPAGADTAPAAVQLWHLARALRELAQPAPPASAELTAFGHLVAFLAHPLGSTELAPLALPAERRLKTLLRAFGLVAAGASPQPALSAADRAAAFVRRADASGLESLRDAAKLIGLAPVKEHLLRKHARVSLARERGEDLTQANHHAIFLGNPGTGKTTAARLYARLLLELRVLSGASTVETSGVKLVTGGISKLNEHLTTLDGGGVLFVDEAYQLEPDKHPVGAQVLDTLLTEMEGRRGKLVVVFAGYADRMEKLLEHNEGLPSRFPDTFVFPDFEDDELLAVLETHISSSKLELVDRKHARIAARRLGLQRATPGFGNARAVRNLWERTKEKQAVANDRERAGRTELIPADYRVVRSDILGPRAVVSSELKALGELEQMVGLDRVKERVRALLALIETNSEREEAEKPIQQITLNAVFLGNPGTGKTTVAKLYGQILAVRACACVRACVRALF